MPSLENGLRRARQRSGLKQAELAARAGISRQTLSALEAGRAQPSTAIALNLARALGCRVEELFWLREGGDAIRAQLATPPSGARRAFAGLVAGRWIAHPLRPDDPFALLAPADALLTRDGLRLLRTRESVEANLLVIGCDPGLAVLAGRLADRSPGQRPRARRRSAPVRRAGTRVQRPLRAPHAGRPRDGGRDLRSSRGRVRPGARQPAPHPAAGRHRAA